MFGNVNGVGEDNCDVVCMVVFFAGLFMFVFGTTINCFCGSSLDVVMQVSCVVEIGDVDLIFVGGVELMSCVLWVMLKFEKGFFVGLQMLHLMTFGWCMVNFEMLG